MVDGGVDGRAGVAFESSGQVFLKRRESVLLISSPILFGEGVLTHMTDTRENTPGG